MALITNNTATSTPADALAAGHLVEAVVIHAVGVALTFQVDGDAGAAAGEQIPADSSATINNLSGRRISVYSASSTPYSIREAL